MKRLFRHILFLSLLLAPAVSCEKLALRQEEGGEGSETVVINIGSAPATKGDTATKSAKDGDAMVNLRVWMVKSGSNTVSYYASGTPDAQTETVKFDKDEVHDSATVTFSNVARGVYTVYFLANSTALDTYKAGSTIDDTFTKAALTLPGGATTPSYTDGEGMPLSLKTTYSVGPGVNHLSAQLIRVCGQINVTIKNRTTDKALYITSIGLGGGSTTNDRNPDKGYIFGQDDHSAPSGTTFGAFPGSTELKRIDPDKAETMLSFYLFESCNAPDSIKFHISGGIYDISATSAEKQGYQATGKTDNTDIDTGKYYFLASASSPRQFLKADSNGDLTLEDTSSDAELFVQDDIKNYLWQFGTVDSPSVKNIGTGKYLNVDYSSASLNSTLQNLSTSISTGRQFYYYYYNYNYLYNNSGKIGVTNSNREKTDANTGWYLREASEYTYQGVDQTPEQSFSKKRGLTYTDSYGQIQPLKSICRNDKVEVIVNIFYNPVSSTFDFEVESWKAVNNETTFD